MDWKKHTLFGIGFTIIIMFIINLIISIKQNLLASQILNVFFPLTSYEFWILSIPIILLYSLLPDLDHKHSKITKWFYVVGFLIIGISYISSRFIQFTLNVNYNGMFLYGFIVMISTFVISKYFKHRGYTHTLWFGIIATLLLMLIGIDYVIYYIVAFLSFWSHLIADKIPLKITPKVSNGWW